LLRAWTIYVNLAIFLKFWSNSGSQESQKAHALFIFIIAFWLYLSPLPHLPTNLKKYRKPKKKKKKKKKKNKFFQNFVFLFEKKTYLSGEINK
jgi:hypothetical protein